MDALGDYQNFGVFMVRRRKGRIFPKGLRKDAEGFLTDLRLKGRRDNTIRAHRNMLLRFSDFLDSVGISDYSNLTSETTSAFIKVVLCNYSNPVAAEYVRILRRFLLHLFQAGINTEDLSSKLIPVKQKRSSTRIPSTMTDDQINAILASVDRESPKGKRDYAVLLIAVKLGLRGCDIRNLQPSNFDWDGHVLSFVQLKTGKPLSLPLPSDVGWAVIDYLKYGRPISDSSKIFIRAVAPYEPLSGLDFILVKYMRKANVRPESVKHHGLHSFRHSLATHMIDENVPITSIQAVLGHVNAQSTQRYIGVNVRQLRSCALEVDE